MKCPECGRKTKVVETREHGVNAQRRRYACLCGHRWSTEEKIVVFKQGPKPKDAGSV